MAVKSRFKNGQSPTAISKKLNKILLQELPQNIESGLFAMYAVLSASADYYVPVDTAALVKSRAHTIKPNSQGGYKMTYGYYTNYAQALHDSYNWNPKPPNTKGKKGGGYNPNAEPNWLNLAWTESGDEAKKVFARIIEPK